ncbi:right-handed parallel beta-helix repeat-containing protein [Pedobacter sp. MC2016-24]|uniref:right-handed parallel beta-helix repeat-containing protein n=1 Tax=Pedobacter sp. MC2016-24 TaxID=2780090 RepID=UPI0018825D77|nr:right-handed parallel beta-helix repeat-containing protein [Pedobacter sp. MC2016-24]MBE9600352.1 right-handed parallel beta-helix repeat-containing protein [Pedobacter sp. MC2016-24]
MKTCFSCLLTVLVLWTAKASSKDIYVAVNGNDRNAGTKASPYASIGKAQLMARSLKGTVTVFLRGGTYYLRERIVFSPDDSRKDAEPLSFKAYPGEHVVISGAHRMSLTWKLFKNGIYQAKVPGDYVFDQLFMNHKPMRMARYPNYNPAIRFYGGYAADALSPERIAKWKNPIGGFVHALHKHEWGGYQYQITGKSANNQLTLEGGFQNNRQLGMHDQYRFVENIFEELDTVGEWYYDKAAHLLYAYPDTTSNLNDAWIEIPQLRHLFEFRGTEQAPVNNIIIEGLELRHTLRTFMETKEPLLRSDWAIYRGGAVFMEGAAHCQIRSCYFNRVGGNAIFLSNYNRNNAISGCHIAYAGASGVCFVGDPKAVRSAVFEYNQFVPFAAMDTLRGPKNDNFPKDCTVENTLMYGLGQVEKQVAGVQISMSMGITVSHNTIYDVPRAGINVSEGTWGGHTIAYNDVFNTVLETGDHGAFNSWGRDRFWHPKAAEMKALVKKNRTLVTADVIKQIVIHDNRFHCDHGWDIDLDDGSSNYLIYNNVCLNGGLKLREGFFRTVENNIILNNSFHPHVWFEDSGDRFEHNLVTRNYYPIRITDWGKHIDHNFFPDLASLHKSREMGNDQHSAYGNPEFINPAAGDYRVKPGSGALLVGFKNFPMDQFGVTSTDLKRLAKKAPIPVLTKAAAISKGSIVEWFGLKIKNLETLGERSATGMPDETGILVLSIAENSPFANYLKPNDVLIAYRQRKLLKIPDLLEEQERSRTNQSIELTVFRNQSPLKIKLDNVLK